MRNLPLLLALLLLSSLGTAATAQASVLPLADQIRPFAAAEEEEEEEEEAEEAEDEAEEAELDRELCEEDPELCEEEEPEPTGEGRRADDECVLRSAKASLAASRGKRRLRLTVRYKAWKPATVSVEASLQSPKGTVHLGAGHTRFRRSGVYRDTFALAEKQMKKAAAARGFAVELHVVNAPASCRVELTAPFRPARHWLRAGAPGRSGDPGLTRGR